MLARRPTSLEDCAEQIVQAEARAAQACRNHDGTDEWAAECDLYELWEIQANLIPAQRDDEAQP